MDRARRPGLQRWLSPTPPRACSPPLCRLLSAFFPSALVPPSFRLLSVHGPPLFSLRDPCLDLGHNCPQSFRTTDKGRTFWRASREATTGRSHATTGWWMLWRPWKAVKSHSQRFAVPPGFHAWRHCRRGALPPRRCLPRSRGESARAARVGRLASGARGCTPRGAGRQVPLD